MPFRPEHSLLRVEVPALHTIDTGSVENLFGMWSLFSKASHAMEDGKRLENLSWRLWNRETFCCAPQTQARSTLSPRCSFAVRPQAATTDIPVPELSTSLESAGSDDLDDDETSSTPATSSTFSSTTIPKARPELRRQDSFSSTSRGREKHITPVDLEKIVQSIKETKQLEPIALPMPTPTNTTASRIPRRAAADPPSTSALQNFTLTRPTPEQQASPPQQKDAPSATQHTTTSSPTPSPSSRTEPLRSSTLESSASTVDIDDTKSSQAQSVGSEDSSSTEMSTHSIVRGFVPGGAPSSYRSQTHLAAQPTPILKTSPTYQQAQQPKKKGPVFTIGTSSGEDESSFEQRYGGSGNGSVLSNRLQSQRRPGGSDSSSGRSNKNLTFKEEVAVGRAAEHSPVFDSDDEDDEVSESAIDDDDDSSDWEDSDDQSGPSSVNERELFQRVDSRPNLTSRRSMLTSLMNEPDRAKALQNAASRSTPALRRSRTSTPNGPSVATSPEPNMPPLHMPEASTRAKPIIMTTSNTHHQQLALSPRTTRRNMLSTELTESLRKNLLWERQHRSTGNLAALKRRHTAQDMTKLKQQPEPIALSHQDGANRGYTNDYFNAGLQEYHAKGW